MQPQWLLSVASSKPSGVTSESAPPTNTSPAAPIMAGLNNLREVINAPAAALLPECIKSPSTPKIKN
ncbi:hypothetical protein E2C01_013709 [Portunus trituberculatus]|uniref:Uncharacterized protein n=1 Tax=Portunus trituberculatus TaxID=210409 RepID=A0A5B7DGZ2_PORTR|nr:hypothetical protein [Portunus trituberculatus]